MSRRHSLRALLAGATHIAIVLSITGAKGAESSTLDTEVKPKTALLPRIVTSDNHGTMALAWSPTRPGNWVFHCHFVSHISVAAQPKRAYRPMRLIVRSKPNVYDDLPGYAYVLGGTPAERDSTTLTVDHGKRYDGDTDRIFVLSDDGPTRNLIRGPFPRVLLNGESQPKPMQLRAGVKYRFRLINIRTDYAATVSIFDDEVPAEWRVVAKDGADLPASQATVHPATLTFAAGEIYDVEFTPTAPGIMTLQFGAPPQGPIPGQATDVQVVVR